MNAGYVLAADMGGTHSRFGLFRVSPEKGKGGKRAALELVRRVTLPTQEARSFTALLETLRLARGDDNGCFLPASPVPQPLDAAVVAVPGPTAVAHPHSGPLPEEVCRCPNISWPLPWADAQKATGVERLFLINDFVAQGFACASLEAVLDHKTVLAGTPRPDAPVALMGAGTGLGQCLVLRGRDSRVLPSEGGHTPFAFEDETEYAFAAFLRATLGTRGIIKDQVVSGSGLMQLHDFLTRNPGRPEPACASPAEDARTRVLFASFYGRVCREYVLHTLPLGGLYITGGVAGHNPWLLTHPAFRDALRGCPSMSHLLDLLPVRHIRNQSAGLWGSAAFAALTLFPGYLPFAIPS
jgi:glucokinase